MIDYSPAIALYDHLLARKHPTGPSAPGPVLFAPKPR